MTVSVVATVVVLVVFGSLLASADAAFSRRSARSSPRLTSVRCSAGCSSQWWAG
ncbi:hypothetical protein V2I01_20480 [Micromonospora sp. BRA006-A]|nr:hypothetical protein [Micromonospora sp. BRA006-A]